MREQIEFAKCDLCRFASVLLRNVSAGFACLIDSLLCALTFDRQLPSSDCCSACAWQATEHAQPPYP